MIEGVVIKKLVTHNDNRGFFREVFRFITEFESTTVGQLSHSLVNKGVIKAWHGHKFQSQWNYVITGKVYVALYDNRVESPTFKEIVELQVGEGENATAYFFPRGVLHGYKCISSPMNIIYVTSGIYDLEDEIRILQNDSSIGYDWTSK